MTRALSAVLGGKPNAEDGVGSKGENMQKINVNGIELAYERRGKGTTAGRIPNNEDMRFSVYLRAPPSW